MKIDEVVSQFLRDCEIRGLSGETLSWYRKRLGLFARKLEQELGVSELEAVKIVHLRQFVQLLLGTKSGANNPRVPTQDKSLSAFTVRGYVRVIKVFFSWCVNEELIEKNPTARLVQPKAPDYLIPTFTVEHVETMLATCDQKKPDGFRNYVLLLVLLDTGMRISELCGLRLTDVHDRYVKVLGKGRKEREIGLHPEVGKLLWKYIHKYRRTADPNETIVFIGRLGEPLRVGSVKSILEDVKKKSGLLVCVFQHIRSVIRSQSSTCSAAARSSSSPVRWDIARCRSQKFTSRTFVALRPEKNTQSFRLLVRST